LVHTDLPDEKAEELLDRLETMLDLIRSTGPALLRE